MIVVLSLAGKNKGTEQQAAATEPATAQPTLYIPTESDTEAPTQPATNAPQPTDAPSATTAPAATEASDPDDATEAPESPATTEAPSVGSGESYTDDSGVLHVFTPRGTNWTYYSDGVSVKITCQYHADQYEFCIAGQIPGVTQFNLYYYTDEAKTTFVKIPVTAVVGDDLTVTRIG